MTVNSRLAAGAFVAGLLAAVPPAAVADTGPSPTPRSGTGSDSQVTTVPLPSSVLQCLVQAGYQITSPATVTLPTPGGTSSAGTGTLTGGGTGGATPPTTGTTSPTTGTTPTTGATGPASGVSSSAGFECGQIIINNTIYLVVITITTTTTIANGPQTAANGPVTIITGSPTTNRRRKKTTKQHKKTPAHKPRKQKRHRKRAGHITLVTKGP